MIASEETVLAQISALLPPPLIFGRYRKCFDTAVSAFLSSSSETKTTNTCYAISSFLSAIWLTQGQFCTISKGTASLT